MELENKELYKEFDTLHYENELPFRADFHIKSDDYFKPHKEYDEALLKWSTEDIRIWTNFERCMIENYKVTSNIIESAYEIMEMSDNGFSFREVEEYIIILKNCFDKET